jgi:hypothetical protein
VGDDVGLIYEMLQSDQALARLAGNLGNVAGNRFPGLIRPVARPGVQFLLRRLAHHVKDRERANPQALLSEATKAGLSSYVTGPLLRQLTRYLPGAEDGQVNFVFGHTHKPFEDVEQFAGFSKPVSLYNTGGWVIDTDHTASLQGAAVVLVDEDGDAASVRMYNQAQAQSDYHVSLAEVSAGQPGDLRSRLASVLAFSDPPWLEFSETVASAVEQRHLLLPQIIARGLKST